MVPLVPKLAVTTPGVTLPVPIAPIMLSPPPALITTSDEKPYFTASDARSVPAASCDAESGGKDSFKVAVPWEEGSKPAAGAQPPAVPVDLEGEVKKLLDHAETEANVADPAGSPLPYEKLAKKAGRKPEIKKNTLVASRNCSGDLFIRTAASIF